MKRDIKIDLKKLILGVFFILLWLIGIVYVGKFYPIKPEPLVIFAGSGSVKNYLNRDKKINLENLDSDSLNIPQSVYINMPSEYTWTLLQEEVERFKGKKDPDDHSFLYICLSAEKICEKDGEIWKKIDPNDAKVYGVYIGEDPLCVYMKDILEDKNTITIQKLSDTIKSVKKGKSDVVYTTSRRSGTYATYRERMGKEKDAILESCRLFYESTVLKGNVMVLSSKYYPPNNKDDFKELTVLDSIGKDTITKSLYIYFVAYKDGNQYILNKHIGTFLKKLIKENSNIIDISKDNIEKWEKYGLRSDDGDTIIYLNKEPKSIK